MSALCFLEVPGTYAYVSAAYAHQVVDAMEEDSASIKQVSTFKTAFRICIVHIHAHVYSFHLLSLPPWFDPYFAGCFRAF